MGGEATKQTFLFDDDPDGHAGTLPVLGVQGSSATLSKAQKQFNKLIARIAEQRRELAQWQAFVPVYHQCWDAKFEPLSARLRERRIAMVKLLDKAVAGTALSKRERAKVGEILLGQLSELLSETQDADLVRLYDKYSVVSFHDAQQQDMDLMRSLASDAFGVDLDSDSGASTPEELAELIGEKVHAARTEHSEQAQRPSRQRPKSAKNMAREAVREQAAQGASQAMREVYRRLASELHPDRELDPEQRKRKTALMQQVNQAYAARDLVALLELQLSIEQLDPAALAGMAQERLAHFNQVLQEQSQRLQEELSEVTMPFVMVMGGQVPRRFTPDVVQRALDADIRELRMTLQALEADLANFQDIRRLKSGLKHYRTGQSDVEELDMLESLLFSSVRTRRR